MIVPLIVCVVLPLPTHSPNRQRAPGDFTSLLTHLTSLPSSQIIPSSSLISTATSPLPTSRAPIPSTDQPSSGQSSAAIAAGVGGGVAVALVLLMVALLLVILVVFVKRRRQDSKPLENVEHKGGFSPLGNPVYTGKRISMMHF